MCEFESCSIELRRHPEDQWSIPRGLLHPIEILLQSSIGDSLCSGEAESE